MPNPKDLIEAEKVNALAIRMDKWAKNVSIGQFSLDNKTLTEGLSDVAAYLRRYGFLLEHQSGLDEAVRVREEQADRYAKEIERLREALDGAIYRMSFDADMLHRKETRELKQAVKALGDTEEE